MAEAYEVLYVVNTTFKTAEGYNKIVAIKPKGWKWGSAELKSENFKILELPLEKAETESILAVNSKCVSADETRLVDAPAEKQVTVFFDYAKHLQALVDDEIAHRKG